MLIKYRQESLFLYENFVEPRWEHRSPESNGLSSINLEKPVQILPRDKLEYPQLTLPGSGSFAGRRESSAAQFLAWVYCQKFFKPLVSGNGQSLEKEISLE